MEGQLIFNTSRLMIQGALGGCGLVYLMEGQVQPYLADSRLASVLEDWCEPFAGYHLYYPSRRLNPPRRSHFWLRGCGIAVNRSGSFHVFRGLCSENDD